MDNIILFVLACAGFTAIMIESTMLQPLRDYLKANIHAYIYKVFECYQCMGFWTGLICGFILLSHNIFVAILCGCAGSFISVFSTHYLTYLEAKTIIEMGKNE